MHYGELSAFWTTWLSRFIPEISPVPFREHEAVPARKKGYPGWKTFEEYERILTNVFVECHRVLKNRRYCIVTFNNKEPEAWIAFLRAVKRAGFVLPKDGVMFQDGVESYKKTIDSRRDGAIFGDFIYSFWKSDDPPAKNTCFNWQSLVRDTLSKLSKTQQPIKNADLYSQLYFDLLPHLFSAIDSNDENSNQSITKLNTKNLENKIREHFCREGNLWFPL